MSRSLAELAGLSALGALGLVPGAGGALDSVAELAWLALLAPAAGAWCGARGIAPGRAAAVPVTWGAALAAAQLGPRALATPWWPLLAVAGAFGAGWALAARLAPGAPAAAAGATLLAGIALAGASLGFGLGRPEAELARAHPRLAAGLHELSPFTLVFDCAGWDWAHAQPDVYARSGVEWFPRKPYAGHLAGPAVLVVGCALVWLARARGGAGAANRP